MANGKEGSRWIETSRFFSVMGCAVRWMLASIFVYFGAVKLVEPSRFAEIIAGFGLVPDASIVPLAVLLPVIDAPCMEFT